MIPLPTQEYLDAVIHETELEWDRPPKIPGLEYQRAVWGVCAGEPELSIYFSYHGRQLRASYLFSELEHDGADPGVAGRFALIDLEEELRAKRRWRTWMHRSHRVEQA